MNERDRLKQLRTLRDHLNRLPPSAERDRMLKEVGSRAVDVESSEPTRPAQPLTPKPTLAGDPADVAPEPAPKPRPPARRQYVEPTPLRAPATPAFTASIRETPALAEGQLLSLEDDVTTPPEQSPQPAPWTRGLRG